MCVSCTVFASQIVLCFVLCVCARFATLQRCLFCVSTSVRSMMADFIVSPHLGDPHRYCCSM